MSELITSTINYSVINPSLNACDAKNEIDFKVGAICKLLQDKDVLKVNHKKYIYWSNFISDLQKDEKNKGNDVEYLRGTIMMLDIIINDITHL